MSRWLRINEDCIDNPKILKLPEALRWQWVALLCVASKNDGVLPPIDDVALCLRVPEAKAAEFITKLVKARLIDKQGDVFVPHNWDKRQFKSDTSKDRVAKYREKRRAAGLPQMGDYSIFRPALIQRDGERCVYCEETNGLVVDHMTPITLGGTDHPDNLALACKPCNSGKAGRTPEMAKKPVIVSSAYAALTRYRDMLSDVTVTVAPPEQSRAETESEAEQSRADASELDETGLKQEGLLKATFLAECANRTKKPEMGIIKTWLLDGISVGTISGTVPPILRKKLDMVSLVYCDAAVREAHAKAQSAPSLEPVPLTEADWRSTVKRFKGNRSMWSRHAGPEPGMAGCRCPVQVLVDADIDPTSGDDMGSGWHFIAASGPEMPAWLHDAQVRKIKPPRIYELDNGCRTGFFSRKLVPDGYDEATGERIAPASEENAA